MFTITFVGDWPKELQSVGERVLAAMEQKLSGLLPTGTVNIKLVDDKEIAALNEEYTGNAYATDVLTFNYQEDEGAVEGELADMAISIETATRQAADAGLTLADEIAMLLVHGLLHTLGYDHQTPDERDRVDRLQRDILELAGITYKDLEWKE